LAILFAGYLEVSSAGSGIFVPPDETSDSITNRYYTPIGQVLSPAGRQIELPGMRPQVLAFSPDGEVLAVAGKTKALVLLDPASGLIRQTVPLSVIRTEPVPKTNTTTVAALEARLRELTHGLTNTTWTNRLVTNTAEISFTGLTFTLDGRHIYFSNAGGGIWAFPVGQRHFVGEPKILPLPDAKVPGQKLEIPTGLQVSGDSRRLYVVGNLGNRLYELDTQGGRLLRSWETGVAPFDVVLAGDKAYVSNLGGRRPAKGDLTAPAGKGTVVRVDSVRRIASEGSVTIIDLAAGQVKSEIVVGLHASALAVSPDGQYVVVANTGSDTLSVIDTHCDQVVETIFARPTPNDLFGAQPNALAFAPNGKQLYVCNGTQNAVAVIQFQPKANASKVLGLIPVGWFPGAIQFDRRHHALCVANIKGIGAAKHFKPQENVKLNSRDYFGTVSLVELPSEMVLARLTRTALANVRHERLAQALLPPRVGLAPRPVPERVGEPSPLKHVIYVIKENRTYDQVLGDMPEGDGNLALCTFGERFTPNQHKLAREFVLLDKTYCAGVCSADGHQWTDSALANEYVERQITSDTVRTYSSGKAAEGVDALAWASSGFIWDNALAHGKTFRNYGEWMISAAGWKNSKRKDPIFWTNYWHDFESGTQDTRLRSRSGLDSLRSYCDTNTVGWDLKVPDVMRAAEFIRELRQFETNGGFPDFILLFLPNDHTGGTRNEFPTPGAQVADNDLALGRIVEAISHSRFWPETCLFAIEDDPQAGWDHVSGYRTTGYLVSPYTRRHETISTPYNHISLVRTMELILGLPPMNQLDASATPMTDCFTDTPDFTPFISVTNRVPLDEMNPEPKKIPDRHLRADAVRSSRLPLDEPDRCPEDLFNRILWRAMKGPQTPYPEWAVRAVEDVD
jgi:YVTN family beta-propeller protein